MSLRRRQRLMLARTQTALGQADGRLAGLFAVFNSLAAGEDMPTTEQVSRRAEIRRWVDRWPSALAVAAIVALLAGPAVIAAGRGPVCGRSTAAARYPAALTRGCLIPGAGPSLQRRRHAATLRNSPETASPITE